MSEHATSRAGNTPPTRGFGQLWQVPTFLLGVVCLSLVAANSKLRHDPAAERFQGELAQLRQALDDRSGKIQPWLDKSGDVLARTERFPAQAAEAYFLVGSLFWRASEEALKGGQEASQRSKAEEYLEKALSLKLADKDLPNLKHRLGVVLYRQGRDFGRALELMKDGLGRGADAGGRGCEILLEAVAKQSNPNLQEAVDIAKRWLERTVDNAETQNRARITLAELLIRMGNRRDPPRYLEAVSKSASKELRLKSQYLLAGCFEAGKQWRHARKIWEDLLKTPEAVPGGKGQILYSLGVCSANDDDTAASLKWWQQVLPLGGEEAQAALVRIGETESAGQTEAALPSWTEALAQVRRPADYRNAYVSLEQVREMFETAAAVLIDKKNFDSVRKLADLYERVAVPGKAEIYRGQAYEALARKASGGEAAALFEKAGLAYEQAALSLTGEERTDPFRRSADCYRLASKRSQSVRVLAELVKMEKGPLPLAEAWLDLAEAYFAQKQTDKARLAWRRCLEIPGTPSGDRARVRLALEEKNAGNLDRAIDYLKQIPVHSLNRAAFEDAQFLHGALLMDMKKYVEAELKLDAAIKEAPSHPSVYRARADLAECYRKEADRFKEIWIEASGKETVSEVTYKKRWREKLELAMLTYQALADDLQRKVRLMEPLSPELLDLLRLASFTTADLLVELGDVGEAVRRYQQLQTERYKFEVEGLIACDRIWRCLPLAKSPQEKQMLLKIVLDSINVAQEDLAKMAPNHPGFENPPGVRSRQEWQTWINERREELARLQAADPAPRK